VVRFFMIMTTTARKAVSPIIATLLLIAIAVAAGIVVYVYVNSLAGGLTGSGGQQVADQISMDAYNWPASSSLTLTIRNTGSSTPTISSVFLDGLTATLTTQTPGSCASGTLATAPGATCLVVIGGAATSATSGTAHTVKVLTATGGTAVITVVAGKSG
jgi:archaeal type IV pilus assembly protein PilA